MFAYTVQYQNIQDLESRTKYLAETLESFYALEHGSCVTAVANESTPCRDALGISGRFFLSVDAVEHVLDVNFIPR